MAAGNLGFVDRTPLTGAVMDRRTIEIIESVRNSNPEVDRLYHCHQDLNRQVDDLNGRSHLTAEDEVELSRLKKEKLHVRDLIEQLVHGRQSA
jgi:uncharacterized protein YdcH (DUF465 family)